MRQVTIQQADSKAEELTVLKANLHTHTTNSDGTFSLPDGSLLSVLEPEASLPSLLREITLTASCETCS